MPKLALSSPNLDARTLRRLILLGVALLSLILTAWLLSAHQQAANDRQTRNQSAAWQQSLSQPKTDATLDGHAVQQRYAMQGDSANNSLNWTTSSTLEVTQSLNALEATGLKLHTISVRRDQQRYTVSAGTQP